MRFTRLLGLSTLLLGAALTPATVKADFINSTSRGFYADTGFTEVNLGNNNYVAGRLDVSGNASTFQVFRDFFVFDLTTRTLPVTSATLRLFNPAFDATIPGSGFESFRTSETFSLFDVSTPTATLTSGAGGVSAFNDLGTGTSFGSTVVTTANNGQFVTIALNAAGLAAVNASLGSRFVVGGSLTTIVPSQPVEQFVFGFTNTARGPRDGNTVLDISPNAPVAAVPLPPTFLAFAFGALGLGGLRFARRK